MGCETWNSDRQTDHPTNREVSLPIRSDISKLGCTGVYMVDNAGATYSIFFNLYYFLWSEFEKKKSYFWSMIRVSLRSNFVKLAYNHLEGCWKQRLSSFLASPASSQPRLEKQNFWQLYVTMYHYIIYSYIKLYNI